MTDADLDRWEARSQRVLELYGSVQDDDNEAILDLIAEVRRLRAALAQVAYHGL